MNIILQYLSPTLVFPLITLIALGMFFVNYLYDKKQMVRAPAEAIDVANPVEQPRPKRPGLNFAHVIHPMTRQDISAMLIITVIYAAIAFWGLGDPQAPETFYRFEGDDYTFTLSLDKPTEISDIMYYTGLWTGNYAIRWSVDGEEWSKTVTAPQSYSKLFNWLYVELEEEYTTMKYIQIWAKNTPLEMGELAIIRADGTLIPSENINVSERAALLFDEQDKVPSSPSYLNSAYFDEIYHARTAYEHIKNVYPYEVSHPPLGKLIIGIGIRLFGMTPFGWRFMGTLFGALMLPFLYVFLKNMFGRTLIASSGTVLFAFDFMHFVQTRIATIDTYGVFFMLAMFFFMYRYIAQSYETPFRKTALPLFFSGLCFGLGAASKWTVIYGGAGLAVLWLLRQILRGLHYRRLGIKGKVLRYEVKTVLFSLLVFVVLPCIIYALSYIPYGTARGMSVSGGMLWNRDFYKMIIDNQTFMFSYHSKLVATHPYSSPWFSWLLDIRPILYYLEYLPNGRKSAFGAFGNPIVWWGGLMALIYVIIRFFKTRDGKALFILAGYLAQILPWVFVSRIVFIYHYFPSTLFLVLSICYVFNTMHERKKGQYIRAIVGFTAAALVLFIAFYPVLTGVPAPQWYTTNFLRWLPEAWPF